MDEQRIGILALGVFVGFLLGLGLVKSGTTLKAAITVVGAALGGAPVIFMSDAEGRWLYPLGLLVGLLWIRVANARTEIAEHSSRPSKKRAIFGNFAWVDMTAVVLVTALGAWYAFLSTDNSGFEQTGQIQLMAEEGQDVFYPLAYESTPNLSYSFLRHSVAAKSFLVTEQRADGFKYKAEGVGTNARATLRWTARGKKQSEQLSGQEKVTE